jgi:hypothetical protein
MREYHYLNRNAPIRTVTKATSDKIAAGTVVLGNKLLPKLKKNEADIILEDYQREYTSQSLRKRKVRRTIHRHLSKTMSPKPSRQPPELIPNENTHGGGIL